MAENDVLIRQATIGDGDSVWPLARDFATSFTPQRDAFDSAFSALVSHPETLLCVAEVRERVVGYLLGSSHVTFLANGRVCWVEEVMVSAEQRRLGIGRALMLTAEHWAAEIGAAYVSLASRRAGDFYEALGYEDSAVFFKKTLAQKIE
jgi:GNAT superfamily N-acetyltransferase